MKEKNAFGDGELLRAENEYLFETLIRVNAQCKAVIEGKKNPLEAIKDIRYMLCLGDDF